MHTKDFLNRADKKLSDIHSYIFNFFADIKDGTFNTP